MLVEKINARVGGRGASGGVDVKNGFDVSESRRGFEDVKNVLVVLLFSGLWEN